MKLRMPAPDEIADVDAEGVDGAPADAAIEVAADAGVIDLPSVGNFKAILKISTAARLAPCWHCLAALRFLSDG